MVGQDPPYIIHPFPWWVRPTIHDLWEAVYADNKNREDVSLRRRIVTSGLFVCCLLAAWGGVWADSALALEIAGAYPSRLAGLEKTNAQEAKALRLLNDDRRRNGAKGDLVWDPRLSAVAREHSDDMAGHDYFAYVSPRLGTIEYRRHRAGSSVANTHVVIYRIGSVEKLVKNLAVSPYARSLREATHLGLGIHDAGQLKGLYVTFISSEVHSKLEAFPTRPIPGKGYWLKGVLDRGYKNPRIIITLPNGKVVEQDPTANGPRKFKAIVKFDQGKGKYMVEVVAIGPLGPAVLDLMNCYVGVPYPEPAPPPKDSGEPPTDLRKAERDMLVLINKARAAAGLKALDFGNDLAAVARAHSKDMVSNNFFAHISPRRGDLDKRMKRARIVAQYYTENLAANRSLIGAHLGLMNSPGHRKNILDPKVNRVGVGIVLDGKGGIMVTENYAQDFTRYDARDLEKELLAAINKARRAKGYSPVRTSSKLKRIADINSRSMASGSKLNSDRAMASLRSARLPYAVKINLLKSIDPPTTHNLPATLGKKATRVGIGIYQTTDTKGPKEIWTTVLVGE
jgi:uncharacterized protein YkwD